LLCFKTFICDVQQILQIVPRNTRRSWNWTCIPESPSHASQVGQICFGLVLGVALNHPLKHRVIIHLNIDKNRIVHDIYKSTIHFRGYLYGNLHLEMPKRDSLRQHGLHESWLIPRRRCCSSHAAKMRGRHSGEQIITDLPKISEYAQTCSRADTIDMLLYSYGHLPVISGYKWDYTFYKWGFVSTYNW
jgi:hypothetical protein